jgi:purine catabolism regulator
VLLTVADVLLMEGLELGLLAGAAGTHREVRWAHAIEVADPLPWLRGGELVLTIGVGLPPDAEGRRAYVRGLAEVGCAGLGFAAEILPALPPDVLRTADECGFPVVAVLGETPFIAVSQAVAGWYSGAAVRAERHAIAVQESTARAALRSGDAGIVSALAKGVGGQALLLDAAGRTRAAHPAGPRDWHERAAALIAEVPGTARTALEVAQGDGQLLLHSVGPAGRPRGWLAVRYPGDSSAHQRLLASHAAVLLTMNMLGIRAAQARLHEQRAQLLGPLLHARPAADAGLDAGLLPAPPYEVLSLSVTAAPGLVGDQSRLLLLDGLDDVLGDPSLQERVLVLPGRPGSAGFSVVLPLAAPRLGGRLCDRLAELGGVEVRAGAATARSAAELPAALRRAGDLRPATAGYRHADDVSAWGLLRDGLAPGTAAAFGATVLAPLREHDGRAGTGLVDSLRTYLDGGANLEAAASALGIHRNTLRGRLRTAQRLTRRSLDRPADRLELWLALSGTDLLGP